MTITEFPIDLDAVDEGLATLFISDAALLVRPRQVPGQYPASVSHDTVHAYRVLNLGNDMDTYQWHIITGIDPRAAHKLLDRVFYAYVDGCCLELWCDARVCYIVDGETVHVEEYGFEDGQYTMIFNVYCGIAADQTEGFLATLTGNETERFLVVRPDSSELGFNVHGFAVEQSDQDDSYDEDQYEDDDRDEECPGGCGQPAYACVCAELDSLRRYNATPMEERCGPWTA
jgi:hypothetical protein